jgi:hypothetical protein
VFGLRALDFNTLDKMLEGFCAAHLPKGAVNLDPDESMIIFGRSSE